MSEPTARTMIRTRALIQVSSALGYIQATGYEPLCTQSSPGFHEYFLQVLQSAMNLSDTLPAELAARLEARFFAAEEAAPACAVAEWWQALTFDLSDAQAILSGQIVALTEEASR